jgi:hypothetical protein
MPMSDTQIRETIEQQLAIYPGILYGAAQNAPRNANGNRAYDSLIKAADDDIKKAAKDEEDGHASAR